MNARMDLDDYNSNDKELNTNALFLTLMEF